ncbi:MAG: response regulator transcription factor [Bacteroidota bacterium]
MNKILLLEDDPSFGYILSEYLDMQDFKTTWVKSAEEGLKALEKQVFDLAILDIMLPNMNGFEFAAVFQQQHPDTPFVFLSAKSLKIDQLKGYKLGAHDYVTKPIDEELLVAKIHALLRPTKAAATKLATYQIGTYIFHPNLHQLHFQEQVTKLTAREADLLELLCQHSNQLLPRKKALQQLWGSQDEFSRKSMDVFISHLRKYLSKDAAVSIENVHGKGFILKCP